MKIAYLVKKFPRLSETFVLGEVRRQELLGHEVVVFARRSADDEPRHATFHELAACVRIVGDDGLNPWRELFSPRVDGAGLFERLARAVPELLGSSAERVEKLVAEALWVLRAAEEEGVEHIHVHFATESAIVAWLVFQLGGPGYSITAHAKDIYRSTVDRGLLSRLVGDSRFTVTVCDANVEHLRGLLEPYAFPKVRRLYNGIDLDDFCVADVERVEGRILTVARLVEKKGIDTLLHALPSVIEKRPAAHLRIVGEGEERPALEQLVDLLGLRAHVTFTGAIDQASVREEMRVASVFCLPCRIGDDGNRDALPTVLLEALAAGVPSVSTPVTGIPEILDHGRAGRLVPEDDPEQLAEAVCIVLGQSGIGERIARAGRAHVERHFDGRIAAKTLGQWFAEFAKDAVSA